MKNKLKPGWKPKWQQTWEKLPPRADQLTPLGKKTPRQHPKPSQDPTLSNNQRLASRKSN